MPNLKITQTGAAYSQDVKRFEIPDCKLTATCPTCGKKITRWINESHYLSYPDINQPTEFSFYHENEVKDPVTGEIDYQSHEWSEQIVIRITVEPVSATVDKDS